MEVSAIIALGSFIVNLLVIIVGGIRYLGRMELSIQSALAKHREDTDNDFVAARREVGEVVLAVRQKITEVELYVRDTYVRRDSFYKNSDDVRAEVLTLGAKIEQRLERMESKIDGKV